MASIPLFCGRLPRLKYFFLRVGVSFLAFLALIGITTISEQIGEAHIAWLVLAYLAISVLLQTSIDIPRLHDLNYSGWRWLINLIPIANIILNVDLVLRKGTVGSNRFGEDPLAFSNARQSLIVDFIDFVAEEKKWWLYPLLAVLFVVGSLIFFAGSSPLAPFIYPLF